MQRMSFCLKDYDAYGFDLDHTLAKYKLKDLMRVRHFQSTCHYASVSQYSSQVSDALKPLQRQNKTKFFMCVKIIFLIHT